MDLAHYGDILFVELGAMSLTEPKVWRERLRFTEERDIPPGGRDVPFPDVRDV